MKSKKIALVGYLADSEFDHCGSYFNAGANVVTVKAAMEAAGLGMTYSVGANTDDTNQSMIPEAVAAAGSADVVVVVLGDSKKTCGEMVDRSDLDLPGGQLSLLRALTATGKPVVVLLLHGRQVTFGRNSECPTTGQWHPPEASRHFASQNDRSDQILFGCSHRRRA